MSDIIMPARGSPVANETLARVAGRMTSGLRTACQSSLPRLVRSTMALTNGTSEVTAGILRASANVLDAENSTARSENLRT